MQTYKLDKVKRIDIVNQIIKEISNHDRRFFYSSDTDKVAYLSIDNKGKIWYWNEYFNGNPFYKEKINLSIPDYKRPCGWQHGGTLLALMRDFCDFIRTGEYSNHNHGYGGLYCPHWAYSEKSMFIIINKAKELGYLK